MFKKKNLIKVFGAIALASTCMLTSVAPASAGDRAAAYPSLGQSGGYIEGGVLVHGGYDFVTSISAYLELYRDGTYLGSKQDITTNYYLDTYAHAKITDNLHSASGLYTMTWSARVTGYTIFNGDWTDAGSKTYYKN
ncbi:hypothetical protein HNR77_002519 [Paenibacillus sp. JGP012]|uniref:hypothetical protein n=1 Tax=Paenibacillus sp. JGP012 TaxID=2735914 RepID=UPI00160EB4AB|nr:hypothetical protein [Paenibacillus sp. JGP012]MBB6021424.1 hypothetical protein [Paenibacillus sp. JGP012]